MWGSFALACSVGLHLCSTADFVEVVGYAEKRKLNSVTLGIEVPDPSIVVDAFEVGKDRLHPTTYSADALVAQHFPPR